MNSSRMEGLDIKAPKAEPVDHTEKLTADTIYNEVREQFKKIQDLFPRMPGIVVEDKVNWLDLLKTSPYPSEHSNKKAGKEVDNSTHSPKKSETVHADHSVDRASTTKSTQSENSKVEHRQTQYPIDPIGHHYPHRPNI